MLQSVYQKVLQEDFEKLGPSLQYSHGNTKYVKAVGIIDVEYGKNIFSRWLNVISKMPPKGLQQKVTLVIERKENEELWTRDFGGKIFRTNQFEKNGYMIERSGPAALKFNLSVKENSIHFIQSQTLFLGIAAPGFIGLQTIANSTESENGWKVEVEVRSPLFGLMLRYKGEVKIET
jgi:hypothetical protein